MNWIALLNTKLGFGAVGLVLVLVAIGIGECQTSRLEAKLARAEQQLRTAESLAKSYKDSAEGYEKVAGEAWKAVSVLSIAVDETRRVSDSLVARSRIDAARARRQASEAETKMRHLEQSIAVDTTLNSCLDLFNRPLPSYW